MEKGEALKAYLADSKSKRAEQWAVARVQSYDYEAALGLSSEGIEEMKHGGAALKLKFKTGSCTIIPRHVCANHYGEGWVDILQPRLLDATQLSMGGGTTFFTTVDPATHKLITEMLKAGEYDVIAAHIWP